MPVRRAHPAFMFAPPDDSWLASSLPLVLALALALVLMLALTCALAACAPASPAVVTFGNEQVRVYVADDPDERSRGLQGYGPLADGEGMVFIFTDACIRTFAMKDVTFPIDVLFIGEDMTASAIEPLDPGDTRTVSSPGPSRYVVELPQGWAAENGIVAGSVFSVSYDSH